MKISKIGITQYPAYRNNDITFKRHNNDNSVTDTKKSNPTIQDEKIRKAMQGTLLPLAIIGCVLYSTDTVNDKQPMSQEDNSTINNYSIIEINNTSQGDNTNTVQY